MFWETCMNSETKPAAISQSKSLNPFNNTQYKTRCYIMLWETWMISETKPVNRSETVFSSMEDSRTSTHKHCMQEYRMKNTLYIQWIYREVRVEYIGPLALRSVELCDLLSCAICSWAVRSVFPLGNPNRQPSHGILTHSCKAKQFGGRSWTFPPLCGQNGESFGAYVTFDFWALFFVCLNDFFFTSVPWMIEKN